MRKTIATTCLALGALVLILCAAFTVVQLTAGETAWFEREFSKLNLADEMQMTLGDLGASVRTLVDYMNGTVMISKVWPPSTKKKKNQNPTQTTPQPKC